MKATQTYPILFGSAIGELMHRHHAEHALRGAAMKRDFVQRISLDALVDVAGDAWEDAQLDGVVERLMNLVSMRFKWKSDRSCSGQILDLTYLYIVCNSAPHVMQYVMLCLYMIIKTTNDFSQDYQNH